jgi:lactate dehydrogenase-like 2-hydroxyacid dehydrogenase
MKEGIVIVGTAEGGVMDDAALIKTIDCGRVRSVRLDVHETEPNIHPGLLSSISRKSNEFRFISRALCPAREPRRL